MLRRTRERGAEAWEEQVEWTCYSVFEFDLGAPHGVPGLRIVVPPCPHEGRLVWPCTANRDASRLERMLLAEIVRAHRLFRLESRVRKYSECRIVA